MRNSIEIKNQWFRHQNTLLNNNYQFSDKYLDAHEQIKNVKNAEKRMSASLMKCNTLEEKTAIKRRLTLETWKSMMKLDTKNDYHTRYRK